MSCLHYAALTSCLERTLIFEHILLSDSVRDRKMFSELHFSQSYALLHQEHVFMLLGPNIAYTVFDYEVDFEVYLGLF